MHIVIITPYAEPEKGACVQRATSFTRYFTLHGHTVNVLAPIRGDITESMDGIIRYKTIWEMIKQINLLKPDVILGTSPPITHSFFALVTAKTKKIRFVLDVRDPFTEYLHTRKATVSYFVKFGLYSVMEYLAHVFADKVTGVTNETVQHIIKKYGRQSKDVLWASNGTDFQFEKITNVECQTIRQQLGVQKDAVLLAYSGSLQDESVDRLIKELIPIVKQHSKLHVLLMIVTDNSLQNQQLLEQIRTLIEKEQVSKKIQIQINLDMPLTLSYLRASDIGLNPINLAMVQATPVKTYEYLTCYLPIAALGPANGSLANFMKKYDVGFFTSTWNDFVLELENAITHLNEFKKKGDTGRAVVLKKFLRQKTNKRVLRLLEELVK